MRARPQVVGWNVQPSLTRRREESEALARGLKAHLGGFSQLAAGTQRRRPRSHAPCLSQNYAEEEPRMEANEREQQSDFAVPAPQASGHQI